MTNGTISVEKQGHILLMGINRPAKYNGFTPTMWDELGAAYGQLHTDDDLRCGVLWAHGDNFTAGVDLPMWTDKFASGTFGQVPEGAIDPLGLSTEPCKKPIVIAVQGICFTLGIELLLASDIRIAAENTRFAQIEIKRGIYPVGGATLRLHMEIGWGNAMRYLLTGDEFSAEVAHNLGMVQEIVTFDSVARAIEVAETIAKQAPLGVYATLASARQTRHIWEQQAIAELLPRLAPIMQSDDVKEGVQSFIERREAKFTGK